MEKCLGKNKMEAIIIEQSFVKKRGEEMTNLQQYLLLNIVCIGDMTFEQL